MFYVQSVRQELVLTCSVWLDCIAAFFVATVVFFRIVKRIWYCYIATTLKIFVINKPNLDVLT